MSAVVTVIVVLLVTFALVASAQPVFASPAAAAPGAVPAALPQHARLVSTSPTDGETLPTATEVALTFSQDVDPRFLVLRVSGAQGDDTDGQPVAAGRTVTQPLMAGLPAGAHTVAYRVVSTDGHAVSGELTFTTTTAPPTATPSPSASATPGSPTPTPAASAMPSASPRGVALPPADGGGGFPWLRLVVVTVALALVVGAIAAWRALSRPPSGEVESSETGDTDGSFRG